MTIAPSNLPKKKPPTIVKNGKRVPAGQKGKKAPDKGPKLAQPKDPEKTAKLRKQAVEKKVRKLTGISRTTAGQAVALVHGYDEAEVKAAALKESICGIKGMNQRDKDEIRKLARESKSRDADLGDLGKRLGSLEMDVQRREVQLVAKAEERSGHRETMKAAMHELRKLIRDKAQGGLLFDQEHKKDAAAELPKEIAANAASPPAEDTKLTWEQTLAYDVENVRGISSVLAERLRRLGIPTLNEARHLLIGVRAGSKTLPPGITEQAAKALEEAIEARLELVGK